MVRVLFFILKFRPTFIIGAKLSTILEFKVNAGRTFLLDYNLQIIVYVVDNISMRNFRNRIRP